MELELKEKKIKFSLDEKEINGIYGNHLDTVIDIIKNVKNKKVSYIKKEIPDDIHDDAVAEQLIEFLKKQEIYPKKVIKKIKDSLKIVGLDEEVIYKQYYCLSHSEQKLVQLAESLLYNPDILILEEPFTRLDLKNKKKILMVLKRIKDQYNKTIVIVSSDPEVLFKETNHLVIFKNDKILVDDNTMDTYRRVEFLKKHKVAIPEIVEMSYLANKNKNAKIDYFRDIRDIIKDIYKHV